MAQNGCLIASHCIHCPDSGKEEVGRRRSLIIKRLLRNPMKQLHLHFISHNLVMCSHIGAKGTRKCSLLAGKEYELVQKLDLLYSMEK